MSKKIVVAGSGLVGLETALLLKNKVKDEANVTVINNTDFFEYRPWRTNAFRDKKKDSFINIRSLLSGKGIGFVKGSVTGIDLDKKTLKLTSSTETFDFLVLSLGSVIDYKNVPGAKEHALPYRTIKDAENIMKHVDKVISEADKLNSAEKDTALTIVICGAGHSGVELASELNEYLDKCCKDKGVRRIDVKLILLEAQPQILGAFPQKSKGYVHEYLSRQGIDIRTSNRVSEIKRNKVIINQNNSISTKTIIWCGGCKPNPLFSNSKLLTDPLEGVVVNPYMQTSEATIYSGGEMASGRRMSHTSPDSMSIDNAVKQASIISHNISTNILGGEKKEYRQKKTRVMIGLGQGNTVIVKGNSLTKGFMAKKIKEMSESSHYKRLSK